MAISKDEGKSWSTPKEIENDPQGCFCYTAVLFLDDRLLLAYCAGSNPKDLSTTRIKSIGLSWLYGDALPK